MLDFVHEAGGDTPRGKATRRSSGYEAGKAGSGASSSRRLAEEPRQSGEVGPDVSEKDEALGTRLAVDGKAFEAPVLEGGITAFGSIAGAVVEAFPGGGADGDVADETTGPVVFEEEAHVENPSEVGVGVEMWALGGGMR